MKAMVFCAGTGTRLLPLTGNQPKALVKVNMMPMLMLTILRLKSSGFTDIIINLHHFPGQIIDFLKEHDNFGVNIAISDESGELLDTGGGLKKASWFFADKHPFLLHNVDVVSDIDLRKMMRFHQTSYALATLAVSKRKSSRYLLFNQNKVLCGWQNVETGEKKIMRASQEPEPYAFSGIHVVEPKLLQLIREEGKFSIIQLYLRLARSNDILGYVHDNTNWYDLGRPENIRRAEQNFDFKKYLETLSPA